MVVGQSRLLLLLPLVAFFLISMLPVGALAVGSIRLSAGGKLLDTEWEPIEQQAYIGLDAVFGGADWPLLLNTHVSGSKHQGEDGVQFGEPVELQGSTMEFGVGVNKTWLTGPFHPYLEAGLLVSRVELRIKRASGQELSDVGLGPGLWVGGGGYWRIGSHVEAGAQVRASIAEGDSEGLAPDSGGGAHLALTLGYGW